MKYLTLYEEFNPKKLVAFPYKNPIEKGDILICINGEDSEGNLETNRTYTVEDVRSIFNCPQVKLYSVAGFWEIERFKSKKDLPQFDIDYYEEKESELDAKKYNL